MFIPCRTSIPDKVIIEKSRGEGYLVEQDTNENVFWPNFFFKLCKEKKVFFLTHSMPKMF